MIGRAFGLGQSMTTMPSVQKTFLGFSVDCSQPAQYYTSPTCWDYTLASWQQMNQIATAVGPMPEPSPPPAVAAGYTTMPPTVSQAQQQIDASIAAGKALSTQNLQSYFGNVATSIANIPTIDCTDFWTNLTNPTTCWTVSGVAPFLLGGFVLLFLVLRK